MSYDSSQVCFVDCETLGLDPERHPIWEIAVIVDGVEHVWQQFWEGSYEDADDDGPDWSVVDEWVVDNTGIRERFDPATAMHPVNGICRFVSLVRGRHLVGACPWFDSERLHRLWLHHGGTPRDLPWHYHLIDVETLAVGYIQGCERMPGADDIHHDFPWTSVDLSRWIGVDPADFEPKHSALADARWAKAMFEAIMGEPI